MPLTQQNRASESGAVAIVVAILSVVLFGIAALVVDLGMAMETRREAQKVADLAALAGGQELPDQAEALNVVAEYLVDNGWPAASIADLDDGDYSNGEVDFFSSTKMLVYPPAEDVDFVFSGVLNQAGGPTAPNGVEVSAIATVEIRSLKDILPFAVTSDTSFGSSCLKVDSKMADTTCPSPTTGNFGYADVGRNSNAENPELQWNIALGLDHNPSRYTHEPEVSQAWGGVTVECFGDGAPDGAVVDESNAPYVDGFNCLQTKTGMTSGPLTRGLLHLTTPSSCDGRIATTASGSCAFLPDRLSEYLSASWLIDPDSAPDGVMGQAVLSDPRFGVVPVVGTTTLGPGTKDYIILDFYGAYITEIYRGGRGRGEPSVVEMSSPTDGQVVAVKAFLFPLRLIPGVGANDSETGTYIGSGPKIPVLVQNP